MAEKKEQTKPIKRPSTIPEERGNPPRISPALGKPPAKPSGNQGSNTAKTSQEKEK